LDRDDQAQVFGRLARAFGRYRLFAGQPPR
jgi:hypothetical protein